MLFVTKYSIRGERTNERIGAMLSLFSERGETPGTVAHYTALDGSFGLTIIESEDETTLLKTTLAYQEWLEIDITPIVTMETAVPHILESLA